ncbi:DUF3135 domain-containing protein [Ferrimonas aestuarii]|uniref:DUF3135 domain-containing protein n=1 Tax=Ferrimonas aestuarii TaxID=2569539 RepID=A0A4U1BV53_9GAMM|nr:DUF3135 domain-containing protein [Ferrimonas aestuarii]TKB58354.1 DUF3135 domain-containing protein [Ferrimonas aestuarii]
MTNRPNFDELMLLAKDNPIEFEHIRQEIISSAIGQATSENHNNLRSLQHRINQSAKQASNPYQSMMEISKMMHEKLLLLDTYLNRPNQITDAKVIFFDDDSSGK